VKNAAGYGFQTLKLLNKVALASFTPPPAAPIIANRSLTRSAHNRSLTCSYRIQEKTALSFVLEEVLQHWRAQVTHRLFMFT
jgi:hypothetical protein